MIPIDDRQNIVYLRSLLNSYLVLTITDDGSVATAWLDPTDKRQQWYREDHDISVLLINAFNGKGLSCPAGLNRGSRLAASGTGDWWNIAGGTPFQAVRSADHNDLNITINAASQDVGTPAILWDWSNGDHQRWALTNLLDMPGISTSIVRIEGGRGSQTVLADDGKQVSVKDAASQIPSDQTAFRKIVYGTAFALQHLATKKFLAYQGEGRGLTHVDNGSANALWTSTDAPGSERKYIRPWVNSNAVIKYDEPSRGVGVFPWGGHELFAQWSWTIIGAEEEVGPHAPAATAAGAQNPAQYDKKNYVVLRSKMYQYIVLSAQSDGSGVVTSLLTPGDPRQQWFREDHDQNFKLFNVATGGGLSTNPVSQANAVVQGAQLYSSGDSELWNADSVLPEMFQAVRAAANTDLNVTINDASQRTPAPTILWEWQDHPHQQWALTSFYDIHGPKEEWVHIVATANRQYVAEINGQLRTGTPSEEHWTKPQYTFRMLRYDDHVAFQNQATKRFFTFEAVKQLVGVSIEPTTAALWRTVSVDGWGGAMYLSPWLDRAAVLKMDPASRLLGVWAWGQSEAIAQFGTVPALRETADVPALPFPAEAPAL